MRDILTALEVDEETGNLAEEEVAINKEIAKVLERGKKDKLSALRDVRKKKLLMEKYWVLLLLLQQKLGGINKG